MGPAGPAIRFLLSSPDPALLEAGAGGELLVARTRVVLFAFIGLAPLGSAILGGADTPVQVKVSLAGIVVALVTSIGIVLALQSFSPGPAIGLLTTSFDTTIVTATLLAAAYFGSPELALNSEAAWAVYLLMIAATALRYDPRIALFSGLLTAGQYLATILWVSSTWNVEITSYAWLIHTARLALIIAATAVSIGIIYRSREMVVSSGRDRLTGLANRAYFEERFEDEIARSVRLETALALVIFDLDRFKRFNDQLGHKAGDEALQIVSDLIRREKRQQDFAARWGGEEFTLILPDTDAAGATRIAERIGTAIRDSELKISGDVPPLTISGGIATFPEDGRTLTELFEAADQRLLSAKRAGRDRITAPNGSAVRD